VRNQVEVFRQIGVNHIGITPAKQTGCRADARHPPASRSSPAAPAQTGTSSRRVPHAGPPATSPVPTSRSARSSLRPRRARPHSRSGQRIGMAQDLLTADLVVKHIETELGLRLRLTTQLPLKAPDLFGRWQTHRQSPTFTLLESAPEVRALSSTGITRLQRSYDPVRLPPEPPPLQQRRGRDPRPRRVSPDCPHHLSGVQCGPTARITSGGGFHPESCRLVW
jgi:hypothetical protein